MIKPTTPPALNDQETPAAADVEPVTETAPALALETLAELTAANSGDNELLLAVGEAYYQLKDYDKAINVLQPLN